MSTSMPTPHDERRHLDSLYLYALQALPANEVPAVETQLAGCPTCRHELDSLRPVVASFASWPTDVLRPSPRLWERLAQRVGIDPVTPPTRAAQPEWSEAAPGISVKLLATDMDRKRVSMLVRLAPATDYPPHRHAGVEELHLLDGELMVDDRKLYPGDYLRSEAGTVDRRVWSETGCTCVLMASIDDVIL